MHVATAGGSTAAARVRPHLHADDVSIQMGKECSQRPILKVYVAYSRHLQHRARWVCCLGRGSGRTRPSRPLGTTHQAVHIPAEKPHAARSHMSSINMDNVSRRRCRMTEALGTSNVSIEGSIEGQAVKQPVTQTTLRRLPVSSS
jgi:hypothetical protein